MSVLIKDIEKPKSCYAIIDEESEYCPFVNTDDDCVLLLKKGIREGTWKEQYSKCPLVEAPEPCEDAVSRQNAINALDDEITITGKSNAYVVKDYVQRVKTKLENLPSVMPNRKKGKWYLMDDGYCDLFICGECGKQNGSKSNFCPHCGADMRGCDNEHVK